MTATAELLLDAVDDVIAEIIFHNNGVRPIAPQQRVIPDITC